jgi:catechol 2,3-dioxygenase-like lactoylglutathione lyase family enzyme
MKASSTVERWSYELSHTGFVVDDLEAAMNEYESLFGVRWAKPVVTRAKWRVGGEIHQVESRVTYSAGRPHHIELMQQIAGPRFPQGSGPPSNHLGFWADDVAAATAELETHGYRVAFYGTDDSGALVGYSFLVPPSGGMIIELVSSARRPAVESWCMGGVLTGGPIVTPPNR